MQTVGNHDRRRHERKSQVRACKVCDSKTLHFSPGQTSDISESGALIRVDRARLFGPGDELEVAISEGRGVVLSRESMIRAIVRRVLPIDYFNQAIAVEFQTPALALAA